MEFSSESVDAAARIGRDQDAPTGVSLGVAPAPGSAHPEVI